MENIKKDLGLILAIVFASAVISGSLVYFGMQMTGGTASGEDLSVSVLDEQIDEAIDRYVEKKQQEAEEEQANAAAERAEKSKEMAKNVPPVNDSDYFYGNEDAKITLIEYSDMQCPYCKRFHETAKGVVDGYDGQVNWVYRHFPLSFHDPVASLQAMAAECAGEAGGSDKYFGFLASVFENNPADSDSLVAAAGELGLDESAFRSCLEGEKYAEKIASDIKDGAASGVNGTPGTIAYNNETGEAVLIEGAQPESALKKVIDDLM